MKISIIGTYPPPYGGISIYLKRFCSFLNEKGVKKILYNSSNFVDKKNNIIHLNNNKKLFKLLFDGSDIIHLNTTGIKLRIIISFYRLFKKKIILSIHGDSYKNQINKNSKNINKILNFQIKRYHHIIVANLGIKQLLIENGVNCTKISVIPAFIPPTSEETNIKQLPDFFNKIRKKYKFLITANAFEISFYNNEDLYGIDLSIEIMNKLIKSGYKDVCFIFHIPNIKEYEYFNKMKILLNKYELNNHFYFSTKPVAYQAVINMCDLFIRPTNTDGDALSIREALMLQKPVITSDVCKRPLESVLFKNRSVEDLYLKTKYVIENYNYCKKQLENIQFEDNAEKILKVYRKVLSKT